MNQDKRPVAALFAGQGSQVRGMGRELAEKSAEAMDLWKMAEKISGFGLRGIYWEGGDEEMADTAALQPALTVVNLNIWLNARLAPLAAAGHSLGEFSALAAACALSPKAVLEITALRGKLMAQANGGAMAAIVKIPASEVEAMVADAARETGRVIVCANYNTPIQTVISGEREAVDLVCAKAKEKRARGVMLPVSGAFHSPMMDEANRELIPVLEKATWSDARFPVYCNVTGSPAQSGGELLQNIKKQMVSPVKWVSLVQNLWRDGARDFVEIAPKAVLGKMVAPCIAGMSESGKSDGSEKPEVSLLDGLEGK